MLSLQALLFRSVWAKQSLRLLMHEIRRGELTIIIFAIALAVATVFSLSGFSERIKHALLNESTSFIAADRVLQSSRSIYPSEFAQQLDAKSEQLGIKQAKQVLMSSMVFSKDKMQLVELKAVSNEYPLRGELLVNKISTDDEQAFITNPPSLGEVYLETKLLNKLNVTIGDTIDIGVKAFIISGVVKQIPDASFNVFSSGASIILNIKDIKATELIQPGSRVTYKYLFASLNSNESKNIFDLDKWIKPKLNDSQRWHDIQSKQSPLANALNRAEKFLSLASLLGIVLAAVAVAVASRRYGQRHQSTVAIFKAMGASFSHIRKLYFLHWALLSIFSICLGLFFGYVLAQVGLYVMQDSLPLAQSSSKMIFGLYSFSLYPLFMSVITGVICAFAFAIIPLKQLVETSPLAVIRGFDNNSAVNVFTALPAIMALFVLLLLFSGDWIVSLSLLAGGIFVSFILLIIARILINIGRSAGTKAGAAWHLAISNLKRRVKENSVQLVSFTIAIKLLLIIFVIKGALLNEWQAQLPKNAPNLFLININKDQVDHVENFIQLNALQSSDLYAVVRGRLTAVNEERINKALIVEQQNTFKSSKKEDQDTNGRVGVGRELNLTWRTELPKENSVIKGEWWSTDTPHHEVSVEEGIAERLKINLGDTLLFQLGSHHLSVNVTSIRKVNWQSMQPNFFMIFSPNVLTDFPATYIASIYVPKVKKAAMDQFLNDYPTITLIDVDILLAQLRGVIDQVSVAIEFILILVIIAGCLVLVAQVQASMEERERELAILRTLGAKGSLLRNSILLEFLALGAIAGLMASAAMELTLYFLQKNVFQMETSFHSLYWVLGIVSGAGFVGLIGMLSCWRLLKLSSVTLIRRTM